MGGAGQGQFQSNQYHYGGYGPHNHCSIRGPLVCFGPPELNNFFVLHYNGFLYEVGINEDDKYDPGAPISSSIESASSSRTHLLGAYTWFSSRSDFKMSKANATVKPGPGQGSGAGARGGASGKNGSGADEDEEDWELV